MTQRNTRVALLGSPTCLSVRIGRFMVTAIVSDGAKFLTQYVQTQAAPDAPVSTRRHA